nr:YbjN domain-containing protein [Longispora albida]
MEGFLAAREIEYEKTERGYAVVLPGTHKLKTVCNLIPGAHALRVEAFVIRQPDENREEVWAYLLRKNAGMYGVSFAIDAAGDVYLTGRMPLGVLDEDELDRLLGAVLTYADENFDPLLELGFASAIRREWAWRVSRGESLANLAAFEHLVAEPGAAEGQVGDSGASITRQ